MSELVAGKTAPERLALCRALLEQRVKISLATVDTLPRVRIMALRRMRAVRSILLGSDSPRLVDEMLSPGGAAGRLLAELDAVKHAAPARRVAFAQRAKGILATLRALERAERMGAEPSVESAGGFEALSKQAELDTAIQDLLDVKNPGAMDPVVDQSIDRGKFGGDLRAELVTAKNASAVAAERLSSLERSLVENYDKVEKELLRLRDQLPSNGDENAYRIKAEAYNEFHAEVYSKAREAKLKELRIKREAEESALSQVGGKLISSVLDLSTITADEAVKWAAAQEITKQAVARLKKIGYPVDKVRADMAEFYRFTGGRVSVVRIHSRGDRRANATDIEAHGKVGTVNLDGSFDKRVLWHELAHHMEADPLAKAMAGRFIRRRSVDGKTYSLRSLSGNKGYDASEKALNGNFFSPYVGKVYASGITEVFSMGVESFSDPVLLARRAMDDPQTLEFVSGFLKAPVDPLERAHIELRNALQEMAGDAEEADGDALEKVIAELAARVRFEPGTDMEWAHQRGILWHVKGFKMVGTLTLPATGAVFHVLTGMVRQFAPRRKVTGFMLVERNADAHGSTNGSTIDTKDRTMMMAIMALHQKDGFYRRPRDMNNAAYLRKVSQ